MLRIFKPRTYFNAVKTLKNEGFRSFLYKIWKFIANEEKLYQHWYIKNSLSKSSYINQTKIKFEYAPKISIVVPLYETPIRFLNELYSSIFWQTYKNWELCLANGSSWDKNICNILFELSKKDVRVKYVNLKENGGISANTNQAIKIASGDYIAFMDHDDVLPPSSLFEIVKNLQKHKYDIVYTDEDMITENLKKVMNPHFKPDFSPDLLCSHNYITHFFVVKKDIVKRVGELRSKYDGSQDYDFVLRCTEASQDILHIPKILYHWRRAKGSVADNPNSKLYAYEAGKKVLIDHFDRTEAKAQVDMNKSLGFYDVIYKTVNNPLLSIIIPNKDHVSDLKKCIDSLENINTYNNIEIIIVENNSSDKDTFLFYNQLKDKFKNIRIFEYTDKFNYSAINNFAVNHVKGEYILFLNNDTQVIEANGLAEMLGICMQKHVGIVGAKLLFENNTVQHAGIVVGFANYAKHVFDTQNKNFPGYDNRAIVNSNWSAVTGACLMTKKSVFENVGGFDETLAVACNDVDYCLKVVKSGLYVTLCPHALLYHFEGRSRGNDGKTKDIKKIKRFEAEKSLFYDKWKDYIKAGDPFYNKNFPFDSNEFSLKF